MLCFPQLIFRDFIVKLMKLLVGQCEISGTGLDNISFIRLSLME